MALGLLILLFTDVLGLHFFFLVTDEGSWQEIGTSLSHFVIAEATLIFLLVFYVLAGAMLRNSVVRLSVELASKTASPTAFFVGSWKGGLYHRASRF